MDQNIPLSTKINNLDNDNVTDITTIIDDIDIDEIIENTNVFDNCFYNEFKNDLRELDSVPKIDHIIMFYLKHIKSNILPKSCTNIFITSILRLLQVIGILFICFGFYLPKKLLKYHIVFCAMSLIFWEYLDNKCYVSLIIQKISNLNNCPELFPINIDFSKNITLLFMFFSIFGTIIPQISLFKILFKIINNLKKYD